LAACSSEPTPPACVPFDYRAYVASADPSFRNDVRPIFAVSCALRSCHGSVSGMDAREPVDRPLDLGPPSDEPPPDDTTLADVRQNLVTRASITAPMTMLVKPGAPEA